MKVYKTRARVYNRQDKGVNKMAKQTPAQLAANRKYKAENTERRTVLLFKSRGDPSLEQIKAAAERDGLSVNAWIIEAIKDKL